MTEVIEQEKTNEELTQKSDEIIDSLKYFNVAEKYKIISNLFYSLKDVIKREGLGILEISKEEEED